MHDPPQSLCSDLVPQARRSLTLKFDKSLFDKAFSGIHVISCMILLRDSLSPNRVPAIEKNPIEKGARSSTIVPLRVNHLLFLKANFPSPSKELILKSERST